MKLDTSRHVSLFRSDRIEEAGFIHGFTTRWGGVSTPPYDNLNLGLDTGDQPSSIEENLRILSLNIGVLPDQWVTLRQIHSTKLVHAEGPNPGFPEGIPFTH